MNTAITSAHDGSTTSVLQHLLSNEGQMPLFEEFQVLRLLSFIGLASAASCTSSLFGITEVFGDLSLSAKSKIEESTHFLGWAAACFIVAFCMVAAGQLLYAASAILNLIKNKEAKIGRQVGIASSGIFAWTALFFQLAAIGLMGQSLHVFGPGPVELAKYGMVGGLVTVALVAMIVLLSARDGWPMLLRVLTNK